jgi:N-acetylneuraminate synthase
MTKIIAEIGINHQGSIDKASQLVIEAAWAGANFVKFQKRTPVLCVPEEQRDQPKETPWGTMSYIDYRRMMEFNADDFRHLGALATRKNVEIFLSVWDLPSAEFAMEQFGPGIIKIPSAKLTDHALLAYCAEHFDLVIVSTGMSTPEEVMDAWHVLRNARKVVWMHCHSAYPAPNNELNLRVLDWLKKVVIEPDEIGYSGHEFGLTPTLVAVALGAQWVERHITLDRWSWGSDQLASIEPLGFAKMVKHIRAVEQCLGDGIKRVWDSELPALQKLRGYAASTA